jgi:hypothetical protein
VISLEQKQEFDAQGYLLARGMFTADEVAFYRDYYMRMRESGTYPGDDAGVNASADDPLKRYPRLIHMHRWDDVSLQWMLCDRIRDSLTVLTERKPYAVQTMLYFKPPGARGQALHQDNYYLRVQPGTCIAAWLALDPCDEENGCMMVVPGSHEWPILCAVKADTTVSFTDVTVPIPEGQETLPMIMDAGDVLFFNGSLVHGSVPNRSPDRFRRALIGHYLEGDTRQVYHWYHPVLRMDGSVVELDTSADGERCGVWVEHEGVPSIEVSGFQGAPGKTE